MSEPIIVAAAGEEPNPDRDFLDEAVERFRIAADADDRTRNEMRDDFKFYVGDTQWTEEDRQLRDADGRPCLTINRIPQFVKQVTNAQRAQKPAVQVSPVDSAGDPKVAEIYQGLIRQIENDSFADVAYSTCCKHQVIAGRGYWRLITAYADEDSFDQVILVRRIRDPFSVYEDPAIVEADGSDNRFTFIAQDVPKSEFIRKYGRDKLTGIDSFFNGAYASDKRLWLPDGAVRIVEYFYKVFEQEEISQVVITDPATGQPTLVSVPSKVMEELTEEDRKYVKVLRTRMTERVQVKWAMITPTWVLDGNEEKTGGRDFPSRYIPVVRAIGDELDIDGKVDLRGMVRDAKDPQRMYSYWASGATEQIALAPKAPWIGAEGQFTGHEQKWNSAHRRSFGFLTYKPVSHAGQLLGPPQRTQFQTGIGDIVQAYQMADNDLKAVMGLYDASLGQSGPEQSGRAILARQRQGEIGNSDYLDNHGRALRYSGRILVDMIPRVMEPGRIVRIIGKDGKQQKVGIGPDSSLANMEGLAGVYDIAAGRYDVTVSAGPSYASRRAEMVDALLQLVNSYPNVLPFIGDLLVSNMDWPGAAEVAARMKMMAPPGVIGEEGQPDLPPEFVQKLNELQQLYQETKQQLDTKQLEVQSKERIAQEQMQNDMRIAAMQLEIKKAELQFKMQIEGGKAQTQAELDKVSAQLDAAFRANQAELDRRSETELERVRIAGEQAIAAQELAANTEQQKAELDSKERIADKDRKSDEKVGMAKAKAAAKSKASKPASRSEK